MLEIFPAIDLNNGNAVRLHKGKIQSAITYGNPYEFAKYFEKIGAKWLHIVDLNGAFQGSPQNFEVIKKITTHTNIRVQIGGGVRTEEHIQAYLKLGVSRIILGSIALQDQNFAIKMSQKYPIAIGIDAKNGKVAIHGWQKTENILAKDFAASFKNTAVEAIICTDISRDGTLNGINIPFSIEIAKQSNKYCIASGGFNNIENLKLLQQEFAQHKINGGVIIGKAFYEKQIDLERVLQTI
ncbi:1-(5-phosphoribosyl)-5-[(5-phosphoribosylamino)methylideneamino]imidazole-4-carboxamide isomerase [Helicobacter anatolicus]|uniref:1-(5-phosphoribosyl)-5-[(5- phosphoribosylamino)methylideneamino]imidazole-4- carboxamide isomerase n=1 Tax=Helicobacter anatolicus TaxID=2905874 RepID=UPI001E5DFE8B|nr:1-(5-phosphoribosyl)-5-[(5-phosphoribosylamino)methylideneamino]imidazole-4-carboxamide isomerase [Helicobacter anatolicus]MCE3037858.1 1-(5-phosphoribosyl)-5-[(5-phosphoribosylamino)methylideneamino]imidazole-4-carboxamide isomerase [Helicobacter anatolicus]